MRVDYGNSELNEVIEELRPKLAEYLIKLEVLPETWTFQNNEKFTCINPDHEDKNPSMSFIPSSAGTALWCWGCQKRADIFKAATWLEGYAADGREWVTDNVYALAKEFEIDFTEYEPTAEDLARAKVLEMLADASDVLYGLIKTSKICDGFQHTRARGLSDEICLRERVGTVDWDEFLLTMQEYGDWDESFMAAHGVDYRVFNREFITITLKDYRGIVIGFDRRYVNWDKEEEASMRKLGKSNEYTKKWLLPKKSDIFDPSTFLFGLHACSKKSYRRLDITEGYMDALSGMQAGHETIVACCGTSGIKQEQMDLLIKLGFEEICIVFDSDVAATKAVKRYLKLFAGRRDIRLTFKFLPFDDADNISPKDKDPDTFFRLYCRKNLEAYHNVPVQSSFIVSLNQEIEKGTSGENLARVQIPHIAGESDPLNRGNMILELASKTGVSEIDIRQAVDQILSGKAQNIARDVGREIEKIIRDSKVITPADIKNVITKADNRLSPLFGGSATAVSGRAAKVNYFETLDAFDNDRGVISGFRTGNVLIDEQIGGIQKGLNWIIAGNPNSGKSAFAHDLICGAIQNYIENKDMVILFFSFDDTVPWSWAKQLANYSGLPIKWVARPQKYIYHDPELTSIYREAQSFYMEMVGDYIRIFGGDIGMNIEQVKKAVKDATETTGKYPVVVIDSFNKMHGPEGTEGHTGYAKNSDELHDMMHNGVSIICTAETTKAAQGMKPEMKHISDTKRVTYNANLVSIVYNPLHEEREKAKFFHVVKGDDGKPRKAAVTEISFVKNRITEYKGAGVFKFNDHIGNFEYIENISQFMKAEQAKWRQGGFAKTLSYFDEEETTMGGSQVFDLSNLGG